jgi:ABC-type lipoprotein export system ATPase subunit
MSWEEIAATADEHISGRNMSLKTLHKRALQLYNENTVVFLSVNPNLIESLTVTRELVLKTLMPQPHYKKTVHILSVTL